MKQTIFDLTYQQLQDWCLAQNEKTYRAKQIFDWLYRKRITSFAEMSDISKALIQKLQENFVIDTLSIDQQQISQTTDTHKYLLKTADDEYIEAVLMSYEHGYSICVTTQVGCLMGCKFCASGLIKKRRDLTAGEIVNQVVLIQRVLDEKAARISNIVVMGIGEPFDNFTHLMNFIEIVNHDLGLAIGARHITVSTCGLAPKIRQFADQQKQVNLAISLHAPNDHLRSRIMPINQVYPLAELLAAIRYYLSQSNRRITFEYILIKDFNDQIAQAKELVALISDLNCYVNLIPYNPVAENDYQRSPFKQQLVFYDYLMKHGIKATLRRELGSDIDAACGQLRIKKHKQQEMCQ